ncbi:unnamed protein product [Clonostachys chloroleuca]|uniref:Uncharacterized protein n=1 Tax=Clonostachys chloroleuca TaxID=1926264 RepID=A0AA35M1Z7_9HYPO|nr:unnamed protein product [Clonostachys chloroleuca]
MNWNLSFVCYSRIPYAQHQTFACQSRHQAQLQQNTLHQKRLKVCLLPIDMHIPSDQMDI